MPGKKKKFNARFPPARIKKIMQSDEEIGKVAVAVPVIISRALELFVESLLTRAAEVTNERHARTLTPHHLRQCIMREKRFDFLQDLFSSLPEFSADGESEGEPSTPGTPFSSPMLTASTTRDSEAKLPRGSYRPRGRGRGSRGRGRKTGVLAPAEEGSKPVVLRGRPRGRPPKVNRTYVSETFESEGSDEDCLELDLGSESENSIDESNFEDESSNSKEHQNISTDSHSVLTGNFDLMKNEANQSTSSTSASFCLPQGIQITIPDLPTVKIVPNISSCSNISNSSPAGVLVTNGKQLPQNSPFQPIAIDVKNDSLCSLTTSEDVDEDYDN